MKCQDFLDRWSDKIGPARINPFLLLHWLTCSKCRREVAFLDQLSVAFRATRVEEDSYFEGMRRELLKAAQEEGFALEGPSCTRHSLKWLFPLVGTLVAMVVVFFLFGRHTMDNAGALGSLSLYPVGEGYICLSQLDDKALMQLDMDLEGAFGEDSSVLFDLATAPWAEVVDQVSAHPDLLDSLLPREGRGGDLLKGIGGVA